MAPPPITMAASKLSIESLHDQLKKKDKTILALQAEKRSYLAAAAEEARKRQHAKMNRGWRKHNAIPHTALLYRTEGTTTDEKANINLEKMVFVSEYRFAIEKIKEMNAEVGLAEARAQTLLQKQRDAYRRTQELIKVAEELKVKVTDETSVRIAESAPKEDPDTRTNGKNTTNSDGDVNMGEFLTATAPKIRRLVLIPPKLWIKDVRATRLRLSLPKREKSLPMEETHPIQLRLSQPSRKDIEESSLHAKDARSSRRRLSQPKPEHTSDNFDRVLGGRVLKASTKTRK